jgi:hypothetical protein
MTYDLRSTLITLLLAASIVVPAAFGQSLISGDIAGTVTDPSHAVVSNARVELKSLDTGSTQTDLTNGTGLYRFSLLRPGNYQVTVKQSGFATMQVPATVAVGQTTTRDIALAMSAATTTVEVSGAAPVVDTTSASISTGFTQQEVALLPNPGGDITNIAQTTPGAQMNNTGGYGNFTMNGLPATSNLFTVNGENDMDPYFNINNSGATNLTIGSNEIEEATVIANAYSGEYGQLSGAQCFPSLPPQTSHTKQLMRAPILRPPCPRLIPKHSDAQRRGHCQTTRNRMEHFRRSIPLLVASVGKIGTRFLHCAPIHRAWL